MGLCTDAVLEGFTLYRGYRPGQGYRRQVTSPTRTGCEAEAEADKDLSSSQWAVNVDMSQNTEHADANADGRPDSRSDDLISRGIQYVRDEAFRVGYLLGMLPAVVRRWEWELMPRT